MGDIKNKLKFEKKHEDLGLFLEEQQHVVGEDEVPLLHTNMGIH